MFFEHYKNYKNVSKNIQPETMSSDTMHHFVSLLR